MPLLSSATSHLLYLPFETFEGRVQGRGLQLGLQLLDLLLQLLRLRLILLRIRHQRNMARTLAVSESPRARGRLCFRPQDAFRAKFELWEAAQRAYRERKVG